MLGLFVCIVVAQLTSVQGQTRDAAKDFTAATLTAVGNGAPIGMWSDGSTMWVADAIDDKIYAYSPTLAASVLDTQASEVLQDCERIVDFFLWIL